MTADGQSNEHLDALIVGAGLSGIGAAHHLQEAFPGRSYAIFEAREDLGGTWDLFRYPGIRSDSDMHTLPSPSRPARRSARWSRRAGVSAGPALGTVEAWVGAILDGNLDGLRVGGADQALAESLIEGLHRALASI